MLVVVFDTLIPTSTPPKIQQPEAMGEQLETSVTLGMRSGAIGGLLSTSLGLGAVSNLGNFMLNKNFEPHLVWWSKIGIALLGVGKGK